MTTRGKVLKQATEVKSDAKSMRDNRISCAIVESEALFWVALDLGDKANLSRDSGQGPYIYLELTTRRPEKATHAEMETDARAGSEVSIHIGIEIVLSKFFPIQWLNLRS